MPTNPAASMLDQPCRWQGPTVGGGASWGAQIQTPISSLSPFPSHCLESPSSWRPEAGAGRQALG